MNRHEQLLAGLLRLGGGVMLLALAAVFMPFAWMNFIHQQLGLGELPHLPIIGYLTRSASALYAFHGAILIFLACDVHRYLAVIQFLAAAGIAVGILMTGLDIVVGMPFLWTIGEGPFIGLFGIVVLWLVKQVKAQAQNPS